MIKMIAFALVTAVATAAFSAVPLINGAPSAPGNTLPKMTENGKSADVIRALTPEQRLQARQREAQKDGIGILKHVVSARSDIRRKDFDGARADLIQAEAVLDHLRLEEPSVTAKDRLTIARQRLNYEKPETVLRDLAAIYTELTSLETYAPQSQARGYVDQARADLQKKNVKGAQYHLQLAERSVAQTQVAIPVDDVFSDLAGATLALDRKNWTTADRWLASIESRLAAPVNATALIPLPTLTAPTLAAPTLPAPSQSVARAPSRIPRNTRSAAKPSDDSGDGGVSLDINSDRANPVQ